MGAQQEAAPLPPKPREAPKALAATQQPGTGGALCLPKKHSGSLLGSVFICTSYTLYNKVNQWHLPLLSLPDSSYTSASSASSPALPNEVNNKDSHLHHSHPGRGKGSRAGLCSPRPEAQPREVALGKAGGRDSSVSWAGLRGSHRGKGSGALLSSQHSLGSSLRWLHIGAHLGLACPPPPVPGTKP